MERRPLQDLLRETGFLELERTFEALPSHNANRFSENIHAVLKLATEHQELLRKIWGTPEINSLRTATALHYASLFSVPALVAFAHRVEPARYSSDVILSNNMHSTADAIAGIVGLQSDRPFGEIELSQEGFDPSTTIGPLIEWHLPDADKRKHGFRHMASGHDIPHAAMAYSMAELMRAGEFLAIRNGTTLAHDDEKAHYTYFSSAFRFAGFRSPESREEMEQIAMSIDALAHETEVTRTLIERLLRTNLESIHHFSSAKASIPFSRELCTAYLRSNSAKIFQNTQIH